VTWVSNTWTQQTNHLLETPFAGMQNMISIVHLNLHSEWRRSCQHTCKQLGHDGALAEEADGYCKIIRWCTCIISDRSAAAHWRETGQSSASAAVTLRSYHSAKSSGVREVFSTESLWVKKAPHERSYRTRHVTLRQATFCVWESALTAGDVLLSTIFGGRCKAWRTDNMKKARQRKSFRTSLAVWGKKILAQKKTRTENAKIAGACRKSKRNTRVCSTDFRVNVHGFEWNPHASFETNEVNWPVLNYELSCASPGNVFASADNHARQKEKQSHKKQSCKWRSTANVKRKHSQVRVVQCRGRKHIGVSKVSTSIALRTLKVGRNERDRYERGCNNVQRFTYIAKLRRF